MKQSACSQRKRKRDGDVDGEMGIGDWETPGNSLHIRTQISCDKGFMKLNTPGVCFTGFLIMIEMPSDMNGLLKSMTRSRSAVIVMAAIAISASCKPRSSFARG